MQEQQESGVPWWTLMTLLVGVGATILVLVALRRREQPPVLGTAAERQQPVATPAPLITRATSRAVPVQPLNLVARCRTLTPVGGDDGDRDAACAAILTADGQGFTLGTEAFRRCRDGIMTDWLPDVQSTRSLPPALMQLEASFACRHLL